MSLSPQWKIHHLPPHPWLYVLSFLHCGALGPRIGVWRHSHGLMILQMPVSRGSWYSKSTSKPRWHEHLDSINTRKLSQHVSIATSVAGRSCKLKPFSSSLGCSTAHAWVPANTGRHSLKLVASYASATVAMSAVWKRADVHIIAASFLGIYLHANVFFAAFVMVVQSKL